MDYSEEFDKAIEEIVNRLNLDIEETTHGTIELGANDERPTMGYNDVIVSGGDFYLHANLSVSEFEDDHEKTAKVIDEIFNFADSLHDIAIALLIRQTEIKTAKDTYSEADKFFRGAT